MLEETEDRIRGSYLRIWENINFLVCEIIATHFFFDGRGGNRSNRIDLLHVILRRANLRFNVEALRYIIERRYPTLWKQYSKTIRSLEEILSHRNLLIHSTLAISEELLPKDIGGPRESAFKGPSSIQLIGFTKGNVRHQTITLKQHEADLAKGEAACRQLSELWRALLKRQERERVSRLE